MSSDAATVQVNRNPAQLDDVVCEIPLAGPDGLVAACRSAHAAQRAWKETPPPVRGQVVANMAQLVAANKEALARVITRGER